MKRRNRDRNLDHSWTKEYKKRITGKEIVRHCKADGQEPDARLTEQGIKQAELG